MLAHSVYIHLPFCKTKCPYCDFASFTNYNDFQPYIDVVCNEIRLRMQNLNDRPVLKTIFFGGGTPSLNSPEQIKQLLDQLNNFADFDPEIEITMEANPGTITLAKMQAFKQAGINRISIGAQTFDEELLQKLGRGHSLQDTFQAIEDMQVTDFSSWSFDLIYGLPKQSPESWQETVRQALDFNPPHISVYALSIESSTPYGSIYQNSQHCDLPVEDILVDMYEYLHASLEAQGLNRYEISNWAKPGHEAQHNLTYWKANEYFAFGVSAHGYLAGQRYANTRDIEAYMQIFAATTMPAQDTEKIDQEEAMQERVMLGLRLDQGIELGSEYDKILDLDKLDYYIQNSYIEALKDLPRHIKLSNKAVLVSNRVIADILL